MQFFILVSPFSPNYIDDQELEQLSVKEYMQWQLCKYICDWLDNRGASTQF